MPTQKLPSPKHHPDNDVTPRKVVYTCVLSEEEKHLSIRSFTDNQMREAYERQTGVCPICTKHFEIENMEANHITPWSKGGKTDASNCQMLNAENNKRKGAT